MDETRRNFLKKAGLASLVVGSGFPLLDAVSAKAGHAMEAASAPAGKQWGMVIDIQKCQDKKLIEACINACHTEHNVPKIDDPKEEVKWLWTEKFQNVFPEQAHHKANSHLMNLPVFTLCNHCTSPSCVRVCPTQATWKRESDGIVMMDMHRCIGCRYCMAACPFGARSFNWSDPRKHLDMENVTEYPTRTKGVVEKCTFCAERLREGRLPACVEAANSIPGGRGALIFGDISDPESEISHVLAEKHTLVRRLEMGTGPNVFYII